MSTVKTKKILDLAGYPLVVAGGFYKVDAKTVAFTKTGNGTASIKAGTTVGMADGTSVSFSNATAITMPTLTAGTDYAIWVGPTGNCIASSSFTSAPELGARMIGGFHYAPGGNAAAQSGGDATPQINEYSFWDLNFKPACDNPRGMVLVADNFWADIYLLGVDHHINGTSKYNVTIADGSSPPKIPLKFGGNGTTAYASLTWYECAEVFASHGKRLPSLQEFAALAYGTTEATSGGTDPVSTILRQAYTSKWGVMLSTGNLWVWGDEFTVGTVGTLVWSASTGGRGSIYEPGASSIRAALFGGSWFNGATSGSRCSDRSYTPADSHSILSGRGVCDHMVLE